MKKGLRALIILFISIILMFCFFVVANFLLNTDSSSSIYGNLYTYLSYSLTFLFVVWYGYSLYRIDSKNIKIITLVIYIIAFLWLLIRNMVWISDSLTFSRYCYYINFIPIVLIPYFFLVLCCENFIYKRTLTKIFIYSILGLISLSFCVFVVSNDYHQLFVSFESSKEFYAGNYSKQPMLFVLLAYALMLLLSTVLLFIFSTTKRNNFTQLFFPFLLYVIITAYSYLLASDNIFVKTNEFLNDYPLVFNILFASLFELMLSNGLIQNNGQYIKNFKKCKLPLKIVDNENNDYYVNEAFNNEAYLKKDNPDLVFFENQISAGKVIIEEDISKIKNLYYRLNNQIKKLVEGNEILLKRKDIQEEVSRNKTRANLYNEIESAISNKSKEIDLLVSLLPDEINMSNKKFTMKVLGKIRMRIGYLKQKCLLILQTKSTDIIANNDFRITLNVICSDIKNSGFESFVCAVKGKSSVPINYLLALNELMEYIGENFGYKRCIAFITCNVDNLRCIIKIESENRKLSKVDIPIDLLQYGYEVSKEYSEYEYTYVMKGVGN